MIAESTEVLSLSPPQTSRLAFAVEVKGASPHVATRTLRVTGPARDEGSSLVRDYTLRSTDQHAYLDLFEALAHDFGTRSPLSRRPPPAAEDDAAVRPVLTTPVSPEILYGYGDPSVLRVGEGEDAAWWLVCTSNDAPTRFRSCRRATLSSGHPQGSYSRAGMRRPGRSLA